MTLQEVALPEGRKVEMRSTQCRSYGLAPWTWGATLHSARRSRFRGLGVRGVRGAFSDGMGIGDICGERVIG